MAGDALGARMKSYEQAQRVILPPGAPVIVRVDGRGFHQYLRGATRPFDEKFMADMDAVAEALCAAIDGTVLAYTQSDEITVVVYQPDPKSQPWFGGVIGKWQSITASLATAVLNERRPGRRAMFDSRVFTLPNMVEVANNLLWRQKDAVRNSIQMAAQAHFSHRQLQGLNNSQLQELLHAEADVNWNDYPPGCRRGRVTVKKTGERTTPYVDKRTNKATEVTAVRTWWETAPAPRFAAAEDNWLAQVLPAMPTLTGPAQ